MFPNKTNPHLVVPNLIVRQPLPAGTEVVNVQHIQELNDAIACLRARLEIMENKTDGINEDYGDITGWQQANEGKLLRSGMIMTWAAEQAPSGWLMCNGSTLNRVDYPGLFGAIGNAFNDGSEGENEFRLPDMRKQFVRGWSEEAGIWGQDQNKFDGSTAAPKTELGLSTTSQTGESAHSHSLSGDWSVSSSGAHQHTATINPHSLSVSTSTQADHSHTAQPSGGHYHSTFANGAKFRTYVLNEDDPMGVRVWDDLAEDPNPYNPSTSAVGHHEHTTNNAGGHAHTVSATLTHDSITTSQNGSHSHSMSKPNSTDSSTSGSHTHGISKASGWDAETKPAGIYMNFIIKV